jgi:hypothetical protein
MISSVEDLRDALRSRKTLLAEYLDYLGLQLERYDHKITPAQRKAIASGEVTDPAFDVVFRIFRRRKKLLTEHLDYLEVQLRRYDFELDPNLRDLVASGSGGGPKYPP